jgi:hypothetical protein
MRTTAIYQRTLKEGKRAYKRCTTQAELFNTVSAKYGIRPGQVYRIVAKAVDLRDANLA